MLPQTLMGVFSSVVTYGATAHPDFIKDSDPTVLLLIQICCGLTWACWVVGAYTTAKGKPTDDSYPEENTPLNA